MIYKDLCLFFKGFDKVVLAVLGGILAVFWFESGVYAGMLFSFALDMMVGVLHLTALEKEEKTAWRSYQRTMPVGVGKVMAGTYKHWDQGTYDGYLRRFDLPGKKPFKDFSRGMKMKLSIAVALSHRPKLLVLDEPFVGLDPAASHLLKGYLRELCGAGGAVFFSTHVLEVAEKMCDTIAIIKDGQLVRYGPTEEVVGDSSLEDVFLGMAEKGAEA